MAETRLVSAAESGCQRGTRTLEIDGGGKSAFRTQFRKSGLKGKKHSTRMATGRVAGPNFIKGKTGATTPGPKGLADFATIRTAGNGRSPPSGRSLLRLSKFSFQIRAGDPRMCGGGGARGDSFGQRIGPGPHTEDWRNNAWGPAATPGLTGPPAGGGLIPAHAGGGPGEKHCPSGNRDGGARRARLARNQQLCKSLGGARGDL